MTGLKGLRVGILVAAAVAIPVLTNGCSAANSVESALCCTGYKPGTDMSAVVFVSGDATQNVQFGVWAQAAGDLNAVIEGSIAEVTSACQGIATDLGADPNGGTTADAGVSGTALMKYWCDTATSLIGTATGSVTLSASFQPPVCKASVSAAASCQGKCSVDASCNASATPPTCEGGTLEISCNGGCTGSASAPTIDCTGSCTGNCSGTCSATATAPTVACNGQCNGTCTAAAGAAGTGIQADGSCNGSCSGTCTAKPGAVSASCTGTCSGKCDAKCTTTPGQASIKCSGTCDAKSTPLTCSGGTFKASCKVDANCQASCNASLHAKAECTPPSLQISGGANATAAIGPVIATLEKNLPTILTVFKARGPELTADVSATLTPSFSLSGQTASCGIIIGASVAQSLGDLKPLVDASSSVVAAAKIGI